MCACCWTYAGFRPEMFYFRWIVVATTSLTYLIVQNQEPRWQRLWCRNRLWARGTCFVFNFPLDYKAFTSHQSIAATYEHIGFRGYYTLLGCICVLDHIKVNKQKIGSIGIDAPFAVKQQQKMKTPQKQNLGFNGLICPCRFAHVGEGYTAHLFLYPWSAYRFVLASCCWSPVEGLAI